MDYEYTFEGFGLLLDKMQAEPDVDLRLYWLGNYVEAAKESWEYAADAEFRALVDAEAAVYATYEEKVTPLYSAKLQISMVIDQVDEIQQGIKQQWLGKLLTAYKDGHREPQMLQMMLAFMESDVRRGDFNPEEYNGLRPEDLR